jgi:hypothetical protein
MNIFVLDTDTKLCAEYHCDKHLAKMITEHNQILGSIAYTARGIFRKKDITQEFVKKVFVGFPRETDGDPFPYGIGYRNHPCTQWAAKSLGNYRWLTDLTHQMCIEYTKRYGKKHAGEEINRWYASNHPDLPMLGLTPFALAMPDICKVTNDAISSYRNYYATHKVYFAKWKIQDPPWWKKHLKEMMTKGLIHEKSLKRATEILNT